MNPWEQDWEATPTEVKPWEVDYSGAAEEAVEEESPSHVGSVPLRIPGTQIGTDIPVPRQVESMMTGLGRGVSNMADGVQDLYLRANDRGGDNADALDRLNARAAEDTKRFNKDFDGDWWAKGGEFGGEVLSTLPVGAALGGITKATNAGKAAAGWAATRLAGTEGFLTESVTRRGDAQERLGAGAVGLVGGYAGDLVMKGIGKGVSKYRGSWDEHGVIAKHREAGEAADKLQQQALDDGGFELDRVDATGVGRNEREALRGTSEFQDYRAIQERQIRNKAESFLPDDLRGVDGTVDDKIGDSAGKVWGSVREQMTEAGAAVDTNYYKWRESLGNEEIELPDLAGDIGKLMNGDGTKAGLNTSILTELDEPIAEIMKKYGLIADDTAEGLKHLVDTDGRRIGTSGFTAARIEEMMQDLNAVHRRTKNSDTQGAIGRIKEMVNEHVDQNMAKLSSSSVESINLGRAATASRREYSEKWSSKSFLGNLNKKGLNGQEWAKDPKAAFRSMMNTGKKQDLMLMKAAVDESGDKVMQAEFRKLSYMPMLEALEKSVDSSTDAISTKRFTDMMKGIDTDVQKALWGEETYDAMQRAMRAWKLHGKKPSQKGAMNNSNTAFVHNMMGAAIRASAAAGGGQQMLVFNSLFNAGKALADAGAKQADADLLMAGKLPKAAQDRLEAFMKDNIKKAYGDPDMAKFDKLLSLVVRNSIREAATREE